MPTFADASLTSLRDMAEVTYGTSPTGTYKERRMVNETLGQDKEVVQSDEIVSDRRNPDNVQVGSSGSGDVVSELTGGGAGGATFDTWDTWWRGALGATGFSTLVGGQAGTLFTAGTITPTNSGSNDIILTVSGGTPANWPAFIAGEFVYVTGFTGVRAVLNMIFRVKSGGGTTALTLTGGPVVPSTPGTESAVNLGVFQLQSITDSTSAYSFSIERRYGPMTTEYALLDGMVLTGFDIDLSPKRPVRVTWHWMGREETSATTQQGSGVTAAITTVKSFGPVSDMRNFALDDDGHTNFVNSFKLSFKNGAYQQDERAGALGAIGIGQGTFGVTGSWETYYESGAEFTKLNGFTDRALSFGLGNAGGFAWLVHLPRINWTGGRRVAAGKDQAVKGTVQFQAARGTTFPYLIKVARL